MIPERLDRQAELLGDNNIAASSLRLFDPLQASRRFHVKGKLPSPVDMLASCVPYSTLGGAVTQH